MTLSEIKFEKDSFVESMVEKHPDLQAMREELSFWLKDPRKNLMGLWRSNELPTVEIDIRIEEDVFLMFFSGSKFGGINAKGLIPLHKGDNDRLYYFLNRGKTYEVLVFGDMDEDGEDNGPEMQIEGYNFYHVEGTCEFYQRNQAMTDDDTIGMAAMKYVESDNSHDDEED